MAGKSPPGYSGATVCLSFLAGQSGLVFDLSRSVYDTLRGNAQGPDNVPWVSDPAARSCAACCKSSCRCCTRCACAAWRLLQQTTHAHTSSACTAASHGSSAYTKCRSPTVKGSGSQCNVANGEWVDSFADSPGASLALGIGPLLATPSLYLTYAPWALRRYAGPASAKASGTNGGGGGGGGGSGTGQSVSTIMGWKERTAAASVARPVSMQQHTVPLHQRRPRAQHAALH